MWAEKNNQLYKRFEFKDFKEAFGFMATVALITESMNHHPDWRNLHNVVEIYLQTHETGKITEKDHLLAKAIDNRFSK